MRNVTFSANVTNGNITTASQPMVKVNDGDDIAITGNALNNNTSAGALGIAIGGSATHVLEAGNEIANFPSGKYGTMLGSALDSFNTSGPSTRCSARRCRRGPPGTLGLGRIATPPTLAANGEGDIYLIAANGLTLQGKGSTYDIGRAQQRRRPRQRQPDWVHRTILRRIADDRQHGGGRSTAQISRCGTPPMRSSARSSSTRMPRRLVGRVYLGNNTSKHRGFLSTERQR